jgi:hypothetical protein
MYMSNAHCRASDIAVSDFSHNHQWQPYVLSSSSLALVASAPKLPALECLDKNVDGTEGGRSNLTSKLLTYYCTQYRAPAEALKLWCAK